MSRKSASHLVAPDTSPVDESLAAVIATSAALYGQWLDLQVSWWSSWLDWQAGWLEEVQRRADELPPWLVRVNGTEQLA
jgi:hypothetical protein